MMAEKNQPQSLFNNQWIEPDTRFQPLVLARKKPIDYRDSIYRVYKTRDDYTIITADSALHAITKSGIDSPVRVIRMGMMHYNLFNATGLHTGQSTKARTEPDADEAAHVGSDSPDASQQATPDQ